MRGGGDQNRAGFSSRLHPRGDIGRVAENVGLLAGARANHHRARIDPDPCGELWMRGLFVELRDRVEDRETRTRGTLGVVVMCLGIAEVGHHAVAKILRDITAEARRSPRPPRDGSRRRSRATLRGQAAAAISVESTRSQNSTVRWRRSPSGTSCGLPCSTTAAEGSADRGAAFGGEIGAAVAAEFLARSISAPHLAQRLPSGDPQSPQNRLLSEFSEPQLVQRIGLLGKTRDPPLLYHPAPVRGSGLRKDDRTTSHRLIEQQGPCSEKVVLPLLVSHS